MAVDLCGFSYDQGTDMAFIVFGRTLSQIRSTSDSRLLTAMIDRPICTSHPSILDRCGFRFFRAIQSLQVSSEVDNSDSQLYHQIVQGKSLGDRLASAPRLIARRESSE
jgi:hypothetical protein